MVIKVGKRIIIGGDEVVFEAFVGCKFFIFCIFCQHHHWLYEALNRLSDYPANKLHELLPTVGKH
ncbi:MAG: hypothetical protein CVT92_16990 [Bacteroidetes bacterium HGW-Bacteroidetes-1]|jgi:hypothetical protein|nr:MAG: hypothetical protein CVT92_16990 [Bacteroidetes bacterium HGW-Bacteroidetes-1]